MSILPSLAPLPVTFVTDPLNAKTLGCVIVYNFCMGCHVSVKIHPEGHSPKKKHLSPYKKFLKTIAKHYFHLVCSNILISF